MYMNLHKLPPGQSMFTLYLNLKGLPISEGGEEYDVVASHMVSDNHYLASTVIDQAREHLVELYGPTVEVLGVVDQSAGEILFDFSREGHVPLPVVVPQRLAETTDRPYDMLLTLVADGGTEYRDWLLGGE